MSDSDPPYNAPALANMGQVTPYTPPRTSPHAMSGNSEELTLDVRQLLHIMLRRWRAAVALGALAALGVVLYGMHMRPVYSATAVVVFDPNRQQLIHLPSAQDGTQMTDSSLVDTKVMMASSPTLAMRVLNHEHLFSDPEFAAAAKHPHDPIGGVERTVQSLSNHLLVRRVGMTWAVQFTFRSADPVKAARLANAFAEEFIDWEAEAKDTDNSKSNVFINDHINMLRQDAEAADAAVQQYKIAHNLMDSAGQTMAQQQVGTLGEQIASAQADLAEKEARLHAADEQTSQIGSNQSSGAALSSTTIAQLRTQQADVSRQLAELRSHYGPRYPDTQKVEGELADINAKIQDEANRVHSSLQADANASAQRLRSLRASQEVAQGSLAADSRAEVGLVELQRRADASRQLYDAFLNGAKQTSVQGAEEPDGHVYNPATVPLGPSSPNMRLIVLLAAAVFSGVAILTMVVLEAFDTSIRDSSDVEKRFELPLIGVLPTPLSSGQQWSHRQDIKPSQYLIDKPFSLFAEAFRNMRAYLIAPSPYGSRSKVIAIASSLPKEGKSTSAFCLMRTMAMSGTSIVLIDGDLRHRGATAFVEPNANAGLVEVLEGKVAVSDALVFDQQSGGWLLPIAGDQTETIDLFSSPAMDALLEDLRTRFSVILIDTPAALAVSDARILASKADGVLYIAQWASTPAKAIELGLAALSSSGSNIIGLALSKVDLKRLARTSYNDGAYYQREYQGYYKN